MKSLKLNLKGIKDILTREEMRKISGGDFGSGSGSDNGECFDCWCKRPDSEGGDYYAGCYTSSQMCSNVCG